MEGRSSLKLFQEDMSQANLPHNPPSRPSGNPGVAPKPFVKIRVDGAGEANCYEGERALVALERAQGLGSLKNMPVKLPVGCRRGGCGVCRVQVTSGSYRADPMSRTHISVEDEAAGLVLSCAIYPLTDIELRVEPPPFVKKANQQAGKIKQSQENE